jgi:predicted ribosome quality control (RQC) complex YloA/Tae2 family protein
MTFDSLMMRRLAAEMEELRGAKIGRVFPTSRLEFVLDFSMRAPLPQIVLNVSAEMGRAHRDDGLEPVLGVDTPLADVLRRHLRGATLLSARQRQFDRVLLLEFGNAEGMGPASRRTLVAEIMGRHSNLLLLDERDYILECARHVTARVNRVRQLIPGEAYVPVPDFGKLDPMAATAEELAARLPAAPQPLTGWLRETLQGGSDVLLAVLLDRLGVPEHATTQDAAPDRVLSVLQTLIAEAARLGPGHVARLGLPFDKLRVATRSKVAYPVPLPGGWTILEEHDSLSAACRAVHAESAGAAAVGQLRQRLTSALQAALDKVRRREHERQAALEKAERADEWRRRGELLMANVWAVEPGQAELVGEDWETGEPVIIPLDPRRSPQENAQALFDRYKKLQRVRQRVPALLRQAQTERQELEDLLDQTEEGGLRELGLLEQEMTARGMLKAPKRRSEVKADYRRGETPEGCALIYGRSALENAAVLKAARPDDLWFHVQGAPGGHVVIRTDNKPEAVSPSAIAEAARLAARQSRRRRDTAVEVDYTLVKHLQRMRNGPPGHVIYREFKTILVKP